MTSTLGAPAATPLKTALPGDPFPLGAHIVKRGVNFALTAPNAERVELCLFSDDGTEQRIDVIDETYGTWHCLVEGVAAGQRYGYRVYGPWDPANGHRFNPAKLLVDPYAFAIDGLVDTGDTVLLPYVQSDSDTQDMDIDERDSADAVPKSVVVDRGYDWQDDRSPRVNWPDAIVYETHVKGFTKQMPGVPEELRGTYAGLASEPALTYLKDLGVTSVELLPVHHIASEGFLSGRGLVNYWGYSTLGYFAPHSGYSSAGSHGEQVTEFKDMVRAIHGAGMEVILDVVYNHSAEGNHMGPMLSLKGVDNVTYYRTVAEDPRFYMDYTGTGNTLNIIQPATLRLVMDSLRHWVTEYHVDGFRFDLASTLMRGLADVDRLSSFLDAIAQDPVLSRVKLVAEPWDVGPHGYQVGGFPVLWSEWNGAYRDDVRDAWRADANAGTLATRLGGSADLYGDDGRRPFASINFITAHDGFTLRDLVSYDEKHNEANGEDNNDGANDNSSWNCGAEGETDDQDVLTLRHRQQRNLLATLLLAQGVPMLLGGDEMGNTQGGNNNAWCQDNDISWLDWAQVDEGLLDYTKQLIALRRAEPVFRRREFFNGEGADPESRDVVWYSPSGTPMSGNEWGGQTLGMFLNGDEIPTRDRRGRTVQGDSFLLLFNTGWEPVTFTLPDLGDQGEAWHFELTSQDDAPTDDLDAGATVELRDRAVMVFRRV